MSGHLACARKMRRRLINPEMRKRKGVDGVQEPKSEIEEEGIVIGIDGARSGWVVATLAIESGKAELFFITSLKQLESLVLGKTRTQRKVCCIAIDMPMGLASRAERGGRACDRAARSLLQQARKNFYSSSSKGKASI